jgi:hypothetical protein
MWLLNKKFILAKDKLAKRRLEECKKCVFCISEESVDYLFIFGPLVCLVRRVIRFTLNIT